MKYKEVIQKELISYANNHIETHDHDFIRGMQEYITSHLEEIQSIIEETKTPSVFLTSAYDLAYNQRDYEFANAYKQALENINEVALFGEDSY